MPTYDYECPKCRKTTEVEHSMKDDNDIYCPWCETVMRKQISAPACHVRNTQNPCHSKRTARA